MILYLAPMSSSTLVLYMQVIRSKGYRIVTSTSKLTDLKEARHKKIYFKDNKGRGVT